MPSSLISYIAEKKVQIEVPYRGNALRESNRIESGRLSFTILCSISVRILQDKFNLRGIFGQTCIIRTELSARACDQEQRSHSRQEQGPPQDRQIQRRKSQRTISAHERRSEMLQRKTYRDQIDPLNLIAELSIRSKRQPALLRTHHTCAVCESLRRSIRSRRNHLQVCAEANMNSKTPGAKEMIV